jgi:acyl-coenzyme A synthetase/AMP-(fatty) acid ligase
LSFDIATLEILLPLACGAKLVVASTEAAASGLALRELISRHDVTVMQGTPASWRLLLATEWTVPERFTGWCGGEALPVELARALREKGMALWNVYGPTETTIWSAIHPLDEVSSGTVPVGRAIRRTQLHVVDLDGNRLPPGVAGHLLIGGDGVAVGYLGDARQSAQRFRPDPFCGRPGARLYWSGDLARQREDGVIEVLGRLDHQVKINGFRVELGEVEAALRTLPGVHDAVSAVRVDQTGHAVLIGYVVAKDDGARQESAWRERLVELLPRYMVPSLLQRLDALPLAPNGKIDRKRLPELRRAVSASKSLPGGPVEAALCAIWSSVFQMPEVGVEDDFFALGGHSLLATQIHARVGRIFRATPPLREVFQATTPRALATVIETHVGTHRAVKLAAAYLHLSSMTEQERAALRRERDIRKEAAR